MLYILGYGNPLRGDDGLGCAAAEALRKQWQGNNNVCIETAHQLTPEVAATLAEARTAAFLDVQADGIPGEILVREVKPAPPNQSALNHHCSPESLLQLTETLYSHVPSLHLFTIVGEDFEYKETVSETIQQALPNYLERINNFIHQTVYNVKPHAYSTNTGC